MIKSFKLKKSLHKLTEHNYKLKLYPPWHLYPSHSWLSPKQGNLCNIFHEIYLYIKPFVILIFVVFSLQVVVRLLTFCE